MITAFDSFEDAVNGTNAKSMECTSAEANKLLHKVMEEKELVENSELEGRFFQAASNEDIESVRPKYDYELTAQKLEELNRKIRCIKHAINAFNSTTEVPGFDMTVDQMLVYLPQMVERKRMLYSMATRLPKQRTALTDGVADYTIANYDINKVKDDYGAISDRIRQAQTALDHVNATKTMTISF